MYIIPAPTFMTYLKWFFLSVINLPLKYFVAWPLTPFIVLCVNKDGELPNWLFWFTTHDNLKLQDDGWIKESRPFLNESNRFKRYINRCFWLWRNSLYGFNHSVLSLESGIGVEKLITKGDDNVGNGPAGHSGLVRRYLYRNGDLIAFQWYYVKQLKHLPRKCIRINLGWKLWAWKQGESNRMHVTLSGWLHKFTP